jgi:phosphatidate cytidylyltransferase
MLKTRIVTALIMIAVLAGALFWAPRFVWIAGCLGCAAVAGLEWARLTKMSRVLGGVFILANILLIVTWSLLELPSNTGSVFFLPAMAFWMVLVPYWLWRHSLPVNSIFAFAAGILTIASASIALVALRDIGPGLVLCVLGVVWVSDSMAYFVGSAFGRHKLAPQISPGKSWEGVGGAVLFVLVYAFLWGYFSTGVLPSRYTDGPAGWIVLAGLMSLLAILGIYGDLFESYLKRVAGVKDSGSILPGHGGALDRIDALLPVLPCAAWLFSN